jgi:hypothetical protein
MKARGWAALVGCLNVAAQVYLQLSVRIASTLLQQLWTMPLQLSIKYEHVIFGPSVWRALEPQCEQLHGQDHFLLTCFC